MSGCNDFSSSDRLRMERFAVNPIWPSGCSSVSRLPQCFSASSCCWVYVRASHIHGVVCRSNINASRPRGLPRRSVLFTLSTPSRKPQMPRCSAAGHQSLNGPTHCRVSKGKPAKPFESQQQPVPKTAWGNAAQVGAEGRIRCEQPASIYSSTASLAINVILDDLDRGPPNQLLCHFRDRSGRYL